LTEQEGNDFGQEAVEEIMARLEGTQFTDTKKDNRPCFIFAGYPIQMDKFVQSNDGLERRITHTFNFDDYTHREILQIFEIEVKKAKFRLHDVDIDKLTRSIEEKFPDLSKYNGSFASITLFQAVNTARSARLAAKSNLLGWTEFSDDEKAQITMSDCEKAIDKIKKEGIKK